MRLLRSFASPRARLLVVAGVVLGGAQLAGPACSVEPIELDGKECPCASGWTCDEATQLCVRPGADASASDGDASQDVSLDSATDASDAPVDVWVPSPLGQTCIGPQTSNANANIKRVSRVVLLEKTEFESIRFHGAGDGPGNGTQVMHGIIYSSNPANGEPDQLLTVTDETTVTKGQPSGWITLPFSKPLSLDPGEYWIGMHTGATSAVTRYQTTQVTAGIRRGDDAYSDGTEPTFGPSTVDAVMMSVYMKPAGVPVDDTQKCPSTGGTGGTGGSGGSGGTGGTGGSTGGTGGSTGGTGGSTGGTGGSTGGTGGGTGGSGGTGGAAGAAGSAGATGSGGTVSDASAD